MSQIKVVLDGSSADWMDVFKNSPEIREGLNRYISAAAAANTARLQGSPGAKPGHRFTSVVDVGDRTLLGKVVPANGAKGVAARAGLPKW